ncbi:MAG: SEC-C domain-containing protein [Polyangiaceae bacterium]|nr:SEC-C domain-containing protein [Polyangiaceae bacterium]MBK8940729.1 SEC-C domain-containing protein [Polyangiaceae bacterium]
MSNLKAPKRTGPCPCQSGVEYGACCQPYHRGEREAPDPVSLMRSRYSAYAAGDVDYLVRTLHPDHSERSLPDELLRSSLRAACRDHRYTGLKILGSAVDQERATVHFAAKVFQKGKDLSFSERSIFAKIDGAWRYLEGSTD